MENKQRFYDFLDEYALFMQNMAESENEKLAALLSGELIRIEHVISQQQAMAKQLENLEKTRTELQRKAGFENMSFMQIIGQAPDDDREHLSSTYNRIEQSISTIKFLNNKSMGVARDNLHTIEQTSTAAPKIQGAQAYGYKKDAHDETRQSNLLEKKV